MAQDDMVIDDAPGLPIREQMNAILAALVTCSCGPLPPPVTYAGMWWLDESVPPNGVMRQRDQADAAWMAPVVPAIIPAGVVRADMVQTFTAGEQLTARTNIGAAPAVGGLEGLVAWFAMTTPPTGWLKANGALVSRTTYAALFAAIGTVFGAGDGTTTFQLPDLRGEWVRGWDDARGVDVGRVFGSAQTGAIKAHMHQQGSVPRLSGPVNPQLQANVLSNQLTEAPPDYTIFNTGPTGGAETRPRNLAELACIHY